MHTSFMVIDTVPKFHEIPTAAICAIKISIFSLVFVQRPSTCKNFQDETDHQGFGSKRSYQLKTTQNEF
jgi:hypothetical protein